MISMFLSLVAASVVNKAALERFTNDLSLRMKQWANGETQPRVFVPEHEVNPHTHDVPCATMPVFEFHKLYFANATAENGAAAAKCPLENSCDDPTVRARCCSSHGVF
jgi:hypothetical protein